jgi:hypothetical protein
MNNPDQENISNQGRGSPIRGIIPLAQEIIKVKGNIMINK